MSLLSDAIELARSRGIVTRQSGRGLGADLSGRSLGGITGTSDAMSHHAEQYKHYQGYPYALIRTIATRIAGQIIKIGRKKSFSQRLNPHAHKAWQMWDRAHGGQRMSKSYIRHYLPNFLKNHASDTTILTRHILLDALARPNPIMVPYIMMFVTVASLELTGKAYWWLRRAEETASGHPEIWPLPASWVDPIHENGKLYSRWKIQLPGVGDPDYLPGDQVVYFYYPDPGNPLSAISPLQANANTVISDENIEVSQKRAFTNGVNPGLALMVGRMPETAGVQGADRPVLTKDQRNSILNAVKAQYRGVMNQEEPLILDGLITDAKRITNSPREMDFLSSGESTKERLSQGWGVSQIVMGAQGSNRAESTVADEHFLNNSINPRIEMFSQILTVGVGRFFQEDEEELVIWVEKGKSHDPEFELSVQTAMVGQGAKSRNEWRADHDLPPIKDGNSVIMGGNVVPVELDDGEFHFHPGKKPPRKPQPGSQPSPSPQPPGAQNLFSDLGTKSSIAILHGEIDRVASPLQRDLASLIVGFGHDLQSSLRGHLSGNTLPPESILPSLISVGDWSRQLEEVCRPHLATAISVGASYEWNMFDPRRMASFYETKKFSSLPHRVAGLLIRATGHYISRASWSAIVGTLLGLVAGGFTTARAESLTQSAAIEHIVAPFMNFDIAKETAGRIAETETAGAVSAGQDAARYELARAGLVSGKRWLCRKIHTSRISHIAAHGQTVGVNEMFTVGGYQCSHPGDQSLPAAERCNCLCTAVSVRSGDNESNI